MEKDFICLVVNAFSAFVLLVMYLCGAESVLKLFGICFGMLIVKSIFFIKDHVVIKVN